MPRRQTTLREAIECLERSGSEKNRAGMARFGIETSRAFGVPMPAIRACARAIVPDHGLAEELWQSGFHEARILASLVDRPQWVDREQMDRWTAEFTSWDVCDQVCGNLWDRTPFAREKIAHWASDEREFVRRAAFATMAWQAVHDKEIADRELLSGFQIIRDASTDPRNYVRKAVNWALRQLGKRSAALHEPALTLARELAASSDRTARWIGTDAVRELESRAVLERIASRR